MEARWLSVASILIDDRETQILFDAAWTRPELSHWLGLKSFPSDLRLVQQVLTEQKISKLSGVFVTHTHFDHCIDAPIVAKLTQSPLFASPSMEIIARAYKDPSIKIIPLSTHQIGQFKVSKFSRVHSEILELFEFLPGKVSKDFNFGFYDYKVGESWIYLLEHPEGNILIDTSGDANLSALPENLRVDVVFQGVANRKDDDTLLRGYVGKYSPKKFIATHFDFFMGPFKPGPQAIMWNVDFERLQKAFKTQAPQTEFMIPSYGKPMKLF